MMLCSSRLSIAPTYRGVSESEAEGQEVWGPVLSLSKGSAPRKKASGVGGWKRRLLLGIAPRSPWAAYIGNTGLPSATGTSRALREQARAK